FVAHKADTSTWHSSRRVGESFSGSNVLVDPESRRILGAHLLGPNAEETINLFTLAIRAGITADRLKEVLWAYPTHASDARHMLRCRGRGQTLSRARLSRSNQAKPEIRRAAADFGLAAAADQIPRTVLIGAQIRSAADDPLGRSNFLRVVADARSLRVVRERARLRQHGVIIRPVPVGAPLP